MRPFLSGYTTANDNFASRLLAAGETSFTWRQALSVQHTHGIIDVSKANEKGEHKTQKSMVQFPYKISQLTKCSIFPCINLNLILGFLSSHCKIFLGMMTSNLEKIRNHIMFNRTVKQRIDNGKYDIIATQKSSRSLQVQDHGKSP